LDADLLDLLRSLGPGEWDLPTVAPLWRVRDVAAHLLDTALRKLSLVRDSWLVEKAEIRSSADLVALVNRLNHEGVAVYRRLSPAVLIDLMSVACEQSATFHEGLDPFAPAMFGVSWAGEMTSLNWFDTARELTERWHHQQQIRLATGRPGGMSREVALPVLDCFLRGLPFAFREVEAPVGTTVAVGVPGECGGLWLLARADSGWRFVDRLVDQPAARVTIPAEVAWKLFTKGCDASWARSGIVVEGDPALADRALGLIAIVG